MSIRTKTFAAVAAVLLLGAAAQAQSTFTADPKAVEGGHFAVEASHTRVQFAVSHLGFSTWYGDFAKVSGALDLDPANPGSDKVDVTIPTATVSTTNAVLDGELKSADWFDAEKYPTIRFVSTRVARTGPATADVIGELTFHGVTRPVILKAKFNGAGVNPLSKAYTVGFEATGLIKRSDFGLTKYVPLVGDQVTLTISAPFERKAG